MERRAYCGDMKSLIDYHEEKIQKEIENGMGKGKLGFGLKAANRGFSRDISRRSSVKPSEVGQSSRRSGMASNHLDGVENLLDNIEPLDSDGAPSSIEYQSRESSPKKDDKKPEIKQNRHRIEETEGDGKYIMLHEI